MSIMLLLAGIGALAWYFAVQHGKRGRRATSCRTRDPLLALAADAVEAGDAQVLLGRRGADPGADRCWASSPRTTASRARLLRHPAGQVAALQRDPHLAHRSSASSGSPPRGWPPGCSSAPAVSGHEPRFQRLGVNVLFVCAAGRRGRLDGRPVAERPAAGWATRRTVLVRPQGYEYVDLGPRLADLPVRRPVPLARS